VGLSPKMRAEAQQDYDAVARRLGAAGWRVLAAGHGASLTTLWPQASISGGRRAAFPAGAR